MMYRNFVFVIAIATPFCQQCSVEAIDDSSGDTTWVFAETMEYEFSMSMPQSYPSLYPSQLPSMFSSGSPSMLTSGNPSMLSNGNPSMLSSGSPSMLSNGNPFMLSGGSPSMLPSDNSMPSNLPVKVPGSSDSTSPTSSPSESPMQTISMSPSTNITEVTSLQPVVLMSPTETPSMMHVATPSQSEHPSLIPTKVTSSIPSFELSSYPSTVGVPFVIAIEFSGSLSLNISMVDVPIQQPDFENFVVSLELGIADSVGLPANATLQSIDNVDLMPSRLRRTRRLADTFSMTVDIGFELSAELPCRYEMSQLCESSSAMEVQSLEDKINLVARNGTLTTNFRRFAASIGAPPILQTAAVVDYQFSVTNTTVREFDGAVDPETPTSSARTLIVSISLGLAGFSGLLFL